MPKGIPPTVSVAGDVVLKNNDPSTTTLGELSLEINPAAGGEHVGDDCAMLGSVGVHDNIPVFPFPVVGEFSTTNKAAAKV